MPEEADLVSPLGVLCAGLLLTPGQTIFHHVVWNLQTCPEDFTTSNDGKLTLQ